MQVFRWQTSTRNESEGCLMTSVVGTLLLGVRGTIDRSSLVIDLSRSISVGTRKSCELCQDRGKPGETLVDAHKRSDVQIVAEILV